ncbi:MULTISPECIES: hypothetical protein [unclassified Arthrobacter]|nr:hypothetical protein [Arthrobacter sp. Leaf234]
MILIQSRAGVGSGSAGNGGALIGWIAVLLCVTPHDAEERLLDELAARR